MDYRGRQHRLNAALTAAKVESLLVTHLPNVRYLCGFTGSSGVLACRAGAKPRCAFFTDGRYTTQARNEVTGARVVIAKKPTLGAALAWLADSDAANVGIEAEHITVAALESIRAGLRGRRIKPTTGLVTRLRMIKEVGERRILAEAVNLGASLFDVAVEKIKPGVTEASVAAAMEFAARERGAEGKSFETIVASGERSALPHGRASQATIGRGFCILDFGVILRGYCSDMTRTVCVGRPDGRARAMYDAVLEAQLAGIAAVRPGVAAEEIDAAARRVLRKARLERFFTHSSGHGVGLEIHEPPRLGAKQSELLQPGMVITIEPGVYLPGTGGVRIEDMVAVTDTGCTVLTPTSKELVVL